MPHRTPDRMSISDARPAREQYRVLFILPFASLLVQFAHRVCGSMPLTLITRPRRYSKPDFRVQHLTASINGDA
jgi:hypothetical protein